jgi:hypothetical protein
MKLDMLDILVKELKDTWGYSTEELNDIREKIEEYGLSMFWQGYEYKGFNWGKSYGKKSDND